MTIHVVLNANEKCWTDRVLLIIKMVVGPDRIDVAFYHLSSTETLNSKIYLGKVST